MRHTRHSAAGFTLVEITVAVVVASIALTATANAVVQGARLSRVAAETRAAMRCSQSLMEQVRSTPYAQIETAFADKTWNMKELGAPMSNGSCNTTVREVSTGSARWKVFMVTSTATWTGVAGTNSQTMTTYVCDRTNGAVQ
jgi:prepilin-type N-terminal cleavage/methylation domain-containing protein